MFVLVGSRNNFSKGQINVILWMLNWESRVAALAKELTDAAALGQPEQENGFGTIYKSQPGESTSPAER